MTKKFPVCPTCGDAAVYKMNVCAVWDYDAQRWVMVDREPNDSTLEDEYTCAVCHPEPGCGSMGEVVWREGW